MSSVPTDFLANGRAVSDDTSVSTESRKKERRKKERLRTGHLKEVPNSRELREKIRDYCRQLASRLDHEPHFAKDDLEAVTRGVLEDLQLPEGYLGWTMVVLSSEFWRAHVASVPFKRRLLLLPHCLKHAEGCPADYDQFGLDCKKCGACSIADFREEAEKLGYKVLVAEGSPIVLKILISGYVDAVVGVACLNVLEKSIDKVLLAGIPCMAVPLLSSDCRNTSVDEDWVHEMIHVQAGGNEKLGQARTPSYLHLLRFARHLFEQTELERLAPPARKNGTGLISGGEIKPVPFLDPIAATETLAREFLAQGGKYARPFITLAAYDAMTGARGVTATGKQHLAEVPDTVRRVALSIETFHKASLVHDDIEDDDDFRYGEPTLHRTYGVPAAVNVGDYMIGLGYRLVSRDAAALGAETANDILDRLADAHLRLSEGQGAELMWRDASNKQITPLDALKIYALKTAPAFEAALLCGMRCAGPLGERELPLKQFAKHLGIAFQILNDLKDWQGDQDNKLSVGLDTLGGRPTILWALALEGLGDSACQELCELMESSDDASAKIARTKQLYHEAGVFDKAHLLVDKYQERAERIADGMDPESLRRLLYYLVDTVLERPAAVESELLTPTLPT
ncbi:MAG: DUF116 domain-containing protein [Planctomycetes bacterium]|nr:DUF116 domain-containing protein [Planctomycetota bacterium]